MIRGRHSLGPLCLREIGGEVLLRMAQVEIAHDWFEEQERSSSSTACVRKTEVTYTKNIEELLEQLDSEGRNLEVVHNVDVSEVRQHLQRWKPAAEKEFFNLRDTKEAFEVRTRDTLPPGTVIVPGKAVVTVKPPPSDSVARYKRKMRFVVCGNFLNAEEGDLYAAGADASTLRLLLAMYAGKDGVSIGTTDIHQPFVLAPWTGTRSIAVQPPKIAVSLGLAQPSDLWLIKKALYGLKESPSIWSAFRDDQLKEATWSVDGVQYRLVQTEADSQLWGICQVLPDGTVCDPEAHVLVYVDDLLMIGSSTATRSFAKWIGQTWECQEPDWLGEEHDVVRFLGMEVSNGPTNEIHVGQKAFIEELVRGHNYTDPPSTSMGAKEGLLLTEEEETALLNSPEETSEDIGSVREAQRRVGELLWLAGRTRPDLQYPVALLSAKLLRNPQAVCTTAHRILGYLLGTKNHVLRFGASGGNGPDNELEIFTDSSFSPSGGRSHGSTVVCYKGSPIVWRSSRQQLTTLSTTESELIEALDGCLLATSIADIVNDLTRSAPRLVLKVDNYSAVQLLAGSTGSWRTRHLRVRSSWLRERIRSGDVVVQHVPGLTQLADLGTKPLPRQRLDDLRRLWQLREPAVRDEGPKVKAVAVNSGLKDIAL